MALNLVGGSWSYAVVPAGPSTSLACADISRVVGDFSNRENTIIHLFFCIFASTFYSLPIHLDTIGDQSVNRENTRTQQPLFFAHLVVGYDGVEGETSFLLLRNYVRIYNRY